MKKTFNLQKTIISLLFSCLILLPTVSCKFNTKQQISENEDTGSGTDSDTVADTVYDTVSVGFNIALPDEYKTNPSRSAIPEFSSNTLRYDVTAAYTENGTSNQITREGFDTVPFYLPLIPEKSYTITVKAYARTDASKSTLFIGEIEDVTVASLITGQNGPFTIPLEIYKVNGNIATGNGSIDLQFIVDYASSQGWLYSYSLTGNNFSKTGSLGGLSRNTPFNINITGIPANSNPYNFVVTFKAGTNNVYQLYTDVMIFAGAVTNTWKNEQELGTGANSNTVVITQALVDAYTSKYFYIKNDSAIEAGGQGTYEAPWRSLQSAFEKIEEINDGISTYRVYILDDLTGSYELTPLGGATSTHYPGKVEFELPSDYTKDLHILIQGIGATKPTLNSASNAPEISVTNASNKTVTLELRNIDCAHEIKVENVDISLTNTNTAAFTSTGTDVTLSNIQATSSISITGGDAELTNINTNLTSSTAVIEVTGGDAVLTNVKAGDITVTNGGATLEEITSSGDISVDGDAGLNDVTATGDITVGGTANSTTELTHVDAGNITVSNGNATLEEVNAATIQVTNGNATMETVTATGDVTVGGTANIGSTTGTVTVAGDITAQSATLTDVTVTGNISVTNGNATFDSVNATATSSSTVITTSGGFAHLTSVHASSITSTITTETATLNGVNSDAISITIPSSNTSGTATLQNVQAATSISVSGGNATLTNVNTELTTCTATIEVTGGNANLTNVKSGSITIDGDAVIGSATTGTISVTGNISVDGDATLTGVTVTGNITVENGDSIFNGVNSAATSSSTIIQTSGGKVQFSNVKASSITSEVSTDNATLSGVNSNTISITIPSSNTSGTTTLQNVQAATSITVSGGNATLTNINKTSASSTNTPVITTSGGTASLTGVNAGNITIGGTANGTSELTNVNAGNITVSNGNATLTDVHAAAIQVTNGNTTMTTLTATGNVTVGGTATIGNTTGTVTVAGDITAQSATLTNVTVNGDITVSNGNAVFKGVNENATSTSTTITVSGGDSTLENIKSAVLTVSGGAARLYNVTCPSIDFTDVDITLIGVTSTPAPATGNNITLDQDCTIKLGGTTAHPNTIGKIYLPNNTSDAQIKFEILNQDTDGSALTLNGSHIGFSLETQPDATISFIQFTEGYEQDNTSDLPNTIFTNLDNYNIGVITPSGQTGYEAGISISSGNINTNFADNITFQIDKSEIERKALNANDASATNPIPSGYTANPRTITVTAKNGDDDLPASSFTTLSLRLVTSTNTVLASNSSNGASITVPYGQTEGNYTLRVFGLYNDGANTVGYSSDFTISVVDNVEFMPTKTILVKDGTTAEKTLSVSGTYNSNNLTIGSLDSTTDPFTITSNANGSASVVLSAASPECGSNAVNVYGHYTTSDNETVYFRDVIPITIVEFIVEFKKNTTVQTGTIYIAPDDTGNNRKIKIDANLHISNSTADDISLNSTAEVHVVRVTGSGANENEEELYIYDDVTPASNEIVYTVPAELPIGFYRIYITFEYEGVTKTIIRNLNISSAGFPVILGGTFNSSTTLSDSSVFIANRNLTIPQLIASDHEVTQGEYGQFMTYISSFAPAASLGLGSDYPAYFVSWYEAIIYCNLKSIADNLTPAYYLVNSSGEEIGGTGNGRNPSTWLNTTTSGTNIAVSNGKYYYNSTTAPSSVLNYNGDTDTDGGIRFDQNANGWRLPTEAEWEYLARGGNLTSSGQTTYSGSNTIGEVAWYTVNSYNLGTSSPDYGTHEVKTKQPNTLGLYDMSGNVYEWCWDWYSSITTGTGATGATSATSDSKRVYRGGSWDYDESYSTVSYRNYYFAYYRSGNLGFRVVRTLSE